MADERPFPRSEEPDIQNLRDYAGSFDLPRQPGLIDYGLYGASQAARALTPHSQAAGWSYAPRGYGLGDILPGQAGRYAGEAEERVRQANPETTDEIERQGAEFSAGIPYMPSTGTLGPVRALADRAIAQSASASLGRDAAAVRLSPVFKAMKNGDVLPEHPKVFNKLYPDVTAALEKKGISRNTETNFLRLAGVIERTPEGWALTDRGRALHGLPGADDAVTVAQRMRAGGADNAAVHRATGLAFTPAGELVRETSDAGARLHLNQLRPGETLPMSDVLEHEALYARRPELSSTPVTGTDRAWKMERGAPPVSEDVGGYVVPVTDMSPVAQEAIRAQMLKRIQQGEQGLSLAGRHAPGTNTKALSGTLARVEDLAAKNPDDAALAAYRDMLRGHAGDVDEVMSGEITPLVRGLMRGRGIARAERLPDDARAILAESMLYNRMPGGTVANLVRARAADPAAAEAAPMPFGQQAYNLPGGRRWGMNAGNPNLTRERMAPIPPASMSNAQLLEFARNWAKYGGRP